MKDLSCKKCDLNGFWGLSCKAGIREELKARLKELGIVLEKKKLDSDNPYWGAEEIRLKIRIKNIVEAGGRCKELAD